MDFLINTKPIYALMKVTMISKERVISLLARVSTRQEDVGETEEGGGNSAALVVAMLTNLWNVLRSSLKTDAKTHYGNSSSCLLHRCLPSKP